jgi:hypothetical protein
LSLDAELGRHIGSKTEADAEAATIRAAILAGTFDRAADRLAREPRQTACGLATSAGIALDAFARIYVDRASKPSEKVSWAKATRERGALHHAEAQKASKDLLH